MSDRERIKDGDEMVLARTDNPEAAAAVAATAEPIEVYAQREDETTGRVSHSQVQFTPTLRRVSLLNTLLFLGLALSNTKLHAHASPSPSKSLAKADHSTASLVVESKEEPPSLTGLLEVIDDEDEEEEEVLEEDTSDEDEEPPSPDGGVIIVSTVDGTLAAVEGSTGRVLWKQAGKGSKIHHQTKQSEDWKIKSNNNNGSKLLQPLTATTTTASSATAASDSSSAMAAIPSINGNVFLTTLSRTSSDSDGSVSKTETASLKDLVARAPYVDSSGRFYVGSRHTTAAAIDSDTGEILYIASAHGNNNEEEGPEPQWEGKSVVWIGRIDYSVSVYNAKSSTQEVRFSASEIMSVNDMVQDAMDSSRRKAPHANFAATTEDNAEEDLFPEEDKSVVLEEQQQPFSALVATPSGNLAYRNQNTGRVEWVADEAFETPIAYAIHSSSGRSLKVDIIPDVTMPSHSKEYLTREIERQIELTLGSGQEEEEEEEEGDDTMEEERSDDCRSLEDGELIQPAIVGTLLNGQLYSMPLGRRHQSVLPAGLSTMQTAQNAQQHPPHQHHHAALDLAAIHSAASTKSLSSFQQENPLLGNKQMPLPVGRLPPAGQQHNDQHSLTTNLSCGPSSTAFPGCLFKAVSRRVVGSLNVVGSLKKRRQEQQQQQLVEYRPSVDDLVDELDSGAVEAFTYPQAQQEIPFQDPYNDPFYQHQQHHQQQQHRPKNYRKVLKILGSWLPPTIALLFVVSFELGRRKRQKDGLDVLRQVTDGNALEDSELLRSADQKGSAANEPNMMIQITDEVLGFGGHGTVVFRGTLEGRNVAVKRMLKTYLASADREISLLIESDGHPNVVRYFLKEVKGDFVYLALELCDLSLHTLIGTLGAVPSNTEGDGGTISNATRMLLLQIASGVRHLHSLRIVHNDLKPANILLALSKEAKSAGKGDAKESIYETFEKERYVAKISDMGLGKMLAGQSSFGASASFRGQSSAVSNGNVGMGPGTVGWMAPEAMRLKSTPSIVSDASNSGDASPQDVAVSTITRASRSVDIFSLGCIFYSTLVPGLHPFGEWYEREANIMHNRPCIEPLKELSVEAYELVSAMIQHNPRSRPTAKQICEHPFFWSLQRKLSFICDLSDRLETDSPSIDNSTPLNTSAFSSHPLAIERNATQVVGLTWDKDLHKSLTEQRYRTYDPSSVRDLLRLIRNKKNHFQDLEVSVRQAIGCNTDGLMTYFESRFPQLLMHCYKVCCEILPSDDTLVEKYSVSDASYPTSYTIPLMQSRREVPPVLTEEPQFASQDEQSQDETITLAEPSEAGEDLKPPEFEEAESVDESGTLDVGPDSAEPDGTQDKNSAETTESNAPSQMATQVEAEPAIEEKAITEPVEEKAVAPPVEEKAVVVAPNELLQSDVVLWEGSTAARTLNCRGWIRSDDEWTSRGTVSKKRNATLVKCAQDPKFRTRLCNHWDTSMGTFCPMRKKNKCVFAHGPVELRVKEGKIGRWGKLVDKNGNNSNPKASGGEDTYGAARSIESARKEEGKWNTKKAPNGAKKNSSNKKKTKG